MITFSEAVRLVSTLESRGWRLGLDRMRAFVAAAGLSHKLGQPGGPQYVHIAGTNGKGSVTAFTQSILREQGWAVGATFSPYVYSVRERVQFSERGKEGSALVSESEFARLVEVLWPLAQQLEATEFQGPTEFEFKTAMGFQCWADHAADWVALEVGMGGRLDATNVVVPAASAIVSIGLDHTQHLGGTLAQIALEKAGIVKEGRPVVVGEVPEEAGIAIDAKARIETAPQWRYGKEFALSRALDGFRVDTPGGSYSRLNPGLKGVSQPHNMAVAIAACEAAGALRDRKLVPRGVAKASAPGRMERATWQGHRLLLDGAHNADAAHSLVASLSDMPDRPKRVNLVTGMLAGHAPGEFYEPLARLVDEAHFVPIGFHRAKSPGELEREAGWLFSRSQAHGSLAEGLAASLESGPDLVLVTGSFYLVGEVGRLIGLADN